MQSKIKVAIVTGTMGMGGAEKMALTLGMGLKDAGYEVTVVTTSCRGSWHDLIATNGLLEMHIEGREKRHPFHHAWRVGKALCASRFHVIIPIKYTNCERFTQACLNMLPDSVIVIPWVHGDTDNTYRMTAANRSAWNVAVGVGARVTQMTKQYCPEKPVLHIPNGLKLPGPDDIVRQNTHHREKQPFRLCYLGRLQQEHKNIFSLPKILAECRKLELPVFLEIVGDGNERQELEKRFQQQQLRDLVCFHGSIPGPEVFQMLSHCHALLMPSESEAMPCAPIEAQASGCVPVASMLPGITDPIIKDRITGFLIPVNDTMAFAKAVQQLSSNENLLKKMSNAGILWAREFSADRMVQRFDTLINECRNGKYPLRKPRTKWLPVNPQCFTWKQLIPRNIHAFGLGNYWRKFFNVSK